MRVSPTRLVPLSSLCARLRLLLDLFSHELHLQGSSAWWDATANLLLPAASIARVVTNASLADLYDAGLYCSTAADYDDTQSDLLDDYTLRLTRFHFVWHAYETVRTKSTSGRKLTAKHPTARLPLLEAQPTAHKELLDFGFHGCRTLANNHPKICRRLHRGNETTVIGNAGLLVAGFRDYLFHGHEPAPEPHDLEHPLIGALRLSPTRSIQASRMTAFTRLTLHMLQALIHADLAPDASMPLDDIRFLSPSGDAESDIPCRFALNLATFWPEANQPRLDERDIEYVASGCDVNPSLLRSLTTD